MGTIPITQEISIDESEIQEEFLRGSGPGGQNVNKVSTDVQLRFDVRGSPSLPEDVRQRLERLGGKRLTTEGVLVIEAKEHRTQQQNREEALARLLDLIRRAAEKPKVRRKTGPTPASKQRRRETKRRRSEIKRSRRWRPGEEG
jgi:ribosome-associated protein